MADAVAERIKTFHWRSLRNVAPDAQYLSPGNQSYKIVQDTYSGQWTIKGYRQSEVGRPKMLQGTFQTFSLADQTLKAYLRTKDRPGRKSIWPGR